MKTIWLSAACLLAFSAASAQALESPAPRDNAELRTLFEQGQTDRKNGSVDWRKVIARDFERRTRVRELLHEGRLRTANDYRHAAFVFQNGGSAADYRIAHALATLAMTLEDTAENRWITAAAWDRLLMENLQPQWYGTQIGSDSHGFYLFPVATSAIGEDERKHMAGRTLEESRAKVSDWVKETGQTIHEPAPTIEDLRAKAQGRGKKN
ncbi:hypothetical protein EBB59_01270 [Lysobacter pythonis]|uniref:Uncharacterized protein n=1 Tax=Solilutibacter pythonis TaxID=2483112 RepID=A0A3M2HYY8_9GAMM|nr:hypothetical protein [Lysobacter pythonis]RMH94946.1 hypothetical protein EBB59_01270 [Lysobacter pythonis]